MSTVYGGELRKGTENDNFEAHVHGNHGVDIPLRLKVAFDKMIDRSLPLTTREIIV